MERKTKMLLIGAGSILGSVAEVGNFLNRFSKKNNEVLSTNNDSFHNDSISLKSDWANIGRDMRGAMNEFEKSSEYVNRKK